jgi:hypothetical protein
VQGRRMTGCMEGGEEDDWLHGGRGGRVKGA